MSWQYAHMAVKFCSLSGGAAKSAFWSVVRAAMRARSRLAVVIPCWYGCPSINNFETPHPWCRAYKLGKQRWSYNQYELLLMLEDTFSPSKQPLLLTVTQAVLIKGNETEVSSSMSTCNWQYINFCWSRSFQGVPGGAPDHPAIDILYLLTMISMDVLLCRSHGRGLLLLAIVQLLNPICCPGSS